VKFDVFGADTYDCIRILDIGARNSAQLLTQKNFTCSVGDTLGPIAGVETNVS
jgi:hypothetical protein